MFDSLLNTPLKFLIDMYTARKLSVFGVFLVRIQSQCGKIRTRKTPNTDPFHAVVVDCTQHYSTIFIGSWVQEQHTTWQTQHQRDKSSVYGGRSHVFIIFYVYQYTILITSAAKGETCKQAKFNIYVQVENIYAWD